eukprot:1150954-Pelagomonas_calceolata.AAC.2
MSFMGNGQCLHASGFWMCSSPIEIWALMVDMQVIGMLMDEAVTAGVECMMMMMMMMYPGLESHCQLKCAVLVQVIDTLLDEVVTAGVERSIDTVLLEPLVLDRILTAVQQQQQQQQQQH